MSKINEKMCVKCSAFMTNYSQLTNHKWLFYGIHIEAEEPRMNAELRGMIAKLQPKSN